MIKTLEEAIRHSGEGWLIDLFAPPEKALENLRHRLVEVAGRARERLGENAPDLSEAAMVELYNRYPLKIKGFFQHHPRNGGQGDSNGLSPARSFQDSCNP